MNTLLARRRSIAPLVADGRLDGARGTDSLAVIRVVRIADSDVVRE